MKLLLTRDSVAMGDDVDAPHGRQYEFPDDLGVTEVITAVVADGYLPRISGGRATWVLTTGGGASLAVVAQQWEEPRLLGAGAGQRPLSSLAGPGGDEVRCHFRYFTQEDPDAVCRTLTGTGEQSAS